MEHNFWHNKWQINQIGFHQQDAHIGLVNYFPKLTAQSKVMVPLCGKSVDMIWLAQQGCRVVGVELSEIAAHHFLKENNLSAQRSDISIEGASFIVFRCKELSIDLYIGDYLKFKGQTFDVIYDRAALVALPDVMRAEYVDHSKQLLNEGGRLFIVTLEYDTDIASGPPFSVDERELTELWQGVFNLLSEQELIDQEERWRKKGLSSFVEKTWLWSET
ncbi:methyltransferase domain-containing protein [Litoribacillus peritrichatus]